jgi:type IV pilus assembly protein PilB
VELARLDHKFFGDEVRPHLGALLLEKGLLTHGQLDEALEERNRAGGLLGDTLVRLGYVFEDDIGRVLAEQQGVPFVDINILSVDPMAAMLLDPELGSEIKAIPVRYGDNGNVVVAVADPLDDAAAARLSHAMGRPYTIVIATSSAITNAWRTFQRRVGL